ncbi:MAG: hypothetical protein IPO22_16110 [Anaerolineales bacterium]|nr:hypothetical protein [Anaerolineales bacterium]
MAVSGSDCDLAGSAYASLVTGAVVFFQPVTIDLEGKEYPALVRERQRNFIKGNISHIDFMAGSHRKNP